MEPVNCKGHQQRLGMWALGTFNIAAISLATHLAFSVEIGDRLTVKRGFALTGLGFVYFWTMYELFNVAAMSTGLGARLRHKYRLSYGEVLDISNKFVSGVQAALSCAAGAVVVASACSRDFMRGKHCLCEAYAWFGAAYFFYDIWSMYMVHIEMNSAPSASSNGHGDSAAIGFLHYCRHEPVILMHHLFIGGFGFMVIVHLRGELGDCTFGFIYLMELSTPFVSLRGVLARLRLKESRLYLVNGLMMLGSFFLCRVVSLPYVVLLYSRSTQMSYLQALKSLPFGCKISVSILVLPQLYWFYLMAAGATRMLRAPSKAPATGLSSEDNSLSCGDSGHKRS